MSPFSNVNKRDYETIIIIGNEGVKHNIKLEE